MSGNWKITGIFLSPRGITLPKIILPDPNLTQPAYSRDTSINRISIKNVNNEQKPKINTNFYKSKGHNFVENCSIRTKFELNLRILVTHLYTKFQLKMSICNGDNERKLKINAIFPSPRGITLQKIIRPDPNSNSTCAFLWQTYVQNFIWKSPCLTEKMSGNWIRKDRKG